jgi:hypothetical protein
MEAYSKDDCRRGFSWLGHAGRYTEISVLHPEYRPGDASWNRSHRSWPVTDYVTSLAGVEDLVRAYAGDRLVCYGLNPRPSILSKPDGRLRSATEADIAASQNLVLDLDVQNTVTPERLDALKRFLLRADEYFQSLGLRRPVRAATGRGSHLLFAYALIRTEKVPDLRDRLRSFRDGFATAVRQDLSRLEVRLDSTQDLRRVVRVYGTAKPGIGIVSRFYGRERQEDAALREHLLQLECCTQSVAPVAMPLTLGAVLPSWFTDLLDRDERLRELWRGEGKTVGDVTSSGYDYSLVRLLVRRGHADPSELGTILSLRPGSSAKELEYVARTVSNALRCTKPVVSS